MKRTGKNPIILFVLIYLILQPSLFAAEAAAPSLRRYALVIGTNDGGAGRIRLKYATRDASAFAGVIQQLGAVGARDLMLLLNPGKEAVSGALDQLKAGIALLPEDIRTELIVYYSGHSNEDGLLLSDELYTYKDFRDKISGIDTDVRIAILDSCYSGSFTRVKGGVRKPAFLSDEANKMQGYAFLTSSSEDEAAQESDRIAGSFFTHNLVTGLRGAADMTRDRLVTLNEAYSYAYSETLSLTENTQFGAQHPRYDIQLTGSGDLVLTDLRETTAGIIFTQELNGRLYIRDQEENLVVELNKKSGREIELGLEPGEYRITLDNGGELQKATLEVYTDRANRLNAGDFHKISLVSTIARGDKDEKPEPEVQEYKGREWMLWLDLLEPQWGPLKLSFFPNIFTQGLPGGHYNLIFNFPLGISAGLTGLEISALGGYITGNATGMQLSGLAAGSGGHLTGGQLSGILNYCGANAVGVQIAGIANLVRGNLTGLQVAGILNMGMNSANALQVAGLVNYNYASLTGVRIASLLNYNIEWSIGLQMAGITNIQKGRHTGLQVAGILNLAEGGITGAQISGIVSLSDGSLNGAQIAGILNHTGVLRGAQIGLINVAGEVMGSQIGLINVSDNYRGGLPLGLVNIEKSGVNHIDLWGETSGFTYLGLRYGTKYSYSILTAGFLPTTNLWRIGVGLGLHLPIKRVFLNLDTIVFSNYEGLPAGPDIQSQLLSRTMPVVRLHAGYKVFGNTGFFCGINTKLRFDGLYTDEVFTDRAARVYRDIFGKFDAAPQFFAGLQF